MQLDSLATLSVQWVSRSPRLLEYASERIVWCRLSDFDAVLACFGTFGHGLALVSTQEPGAVDMHARIKGRARTIPDAWDRSSVDMSGTLGIVSCTFGTKSMKNDGFDV